MPILGAVPRNAPPDPSPRARTRPATFRIGVAVIVLAVLAVRVWSASRSTWLLDDWVYMHQARSMGFVEFVFQNYNGHVMPGEFLMVWLTTAVGSLSFDVVVIWVAVASAAATALWALAVRELCGERPVALIPLALVSLTPLHVQGTIWWAAALQAIPMHATIAGCVFFAARVARGGRRSDRVGLLLTYVGGLVMWEKALLVAIPIAAVMIYLAPRGPGRWPRILREGVPVTVAAVVYAPIFVVLTQRESTGPYPVEFKLQPISAILGSFGELAGHLLAPGLLGGPWGTLPVPSDLQAHPGEWQIAVVGAVVGAGLLLLGLTRRSSWVPIAMVVVFAALSWGLLTLSTRLDGFWLSRNGYERYAVDTFSVLCLAVALWLTPEAARGAAPDGRRRTASWIASRVGTRSRVLAVGSVGAVLASLGVSNVVAVHRLGVAPGRDWVENVRADVAAQAPVTVIDGYAPDEVLFAPFFGEYARLSGMLSPLGDQVRFDGTAEPLHVIDGDGRLVPVAVAAATRSVPGPVPDCGYPLSAGEGVDVPMTNPLYTYAWVLQVNAFSSAPAVLQVEVGGETHSYDIRAGLNSPQTTVVLEVADHVRVSAISGDGTICVTDVMVGPPAGPEGP